MNALCIICRRPDKIWLDFLNGFTKYKTYLMIDDYSIDYKDIYKNTYSNINFIQISDKDCEKHGFINSSSTVGLKKIIAWDKGLYYFSTINKSHEYVWFMEDDVFFHNETTILNIDRNYPSSDLLTTDNDYGVCNNARTKAMEWHWPRININHAFPYCKSMICSVRMSKSMLHSIRKYAHSNDTLFFIEAMFPTIASINKLKYDKPSEMYPVYWRHDFKDEDFDKLKIYHPVKKLDDHTKIRNTI